ncbi:thiol-disulfide oxidoreductase LTO1-like isoform X3 [Tasmannia lanceolata]|uniref:thiol-disulfide oxidoreductase LTO1-like isoform X3 n=1 Tax=Tasmannia lanceolata TaxID=3420 RepID=UPI004063540F
MECRTWNLRVSRNWIFNLPQTHQFLYFLPYRRRHLQRCSQQRLRGCFRMADIDLQPFETEITMQSSPLALSLAKHLQSIGAKMYGAFWCSHCLEQKQMFGREAAEIVDYIECFPTGVGRGRKIAEACKDVGIEGFPTWVIKGKVLSGEQTFSELIEASGFVLEDFQPM